MTKRLITLLLSIGIGTLIAPHNGSETWKKLADCLNDYKDKLGDEAEELGEKAKKFVNENQ